MKLLPEPGCTRIQKFTKMFDISTPTYYRGVKTGRFPGAVPIAPNIRAIPNCYINKYILKLLEIAAEAEEARKQLQSQAESEEQDNVPKQKEEEDEVEDIAA